MSKFNLYSVCINAIELIVDGKYLATKWNAVSLRGVSWVLELWNVWPLLFNPYPVPGTVYPVPGTVYSVPLPGASWAFLECLFLHFFTFAGISISVPERQIMPIYIFSDKMYFLSFFSPAMRCFRLQSGIRASPLECTGAGCTAAGWFDIWYYYMYWYISWSISWYLYMIYDI